MKKIQILMSTYNGERYIREQLDSIMAQDYPELSLLIRDDGSKDATVDRIEEYAATHPQRKITLIKGDNLGVLDSFMFLVEAADDDCDYFAFADQDDVWHPDKISRAVRALEEDPDALFYAGAYLPVDQDLHPIRTRAAKKKPSFYNAIVENIAIGCTIVFTRKMRELTRGVDIQGACIHDWWFYILATAVGHIVYDPKPSLYYRQHSANAIGSKDSVLKKWKTRSRRLKDWRREVFTHCELLLEHYRDRMDKDKVAALETFLGYRELGLFKRLAYLAGTPIHRQTVLDELLLKILLLFRRIGG